MDSLQLAICIVVVFLIIVKLARCSCGCGCFRWCKCVNSGCCCKEKFSSRRVVTLHYANWCPHCTAMKPVFALVSSNTPDVTFITNDEEKNKTDWVDSYPTIAMIDEYGRREIYNGPADYAKLRGWVVERR